MKVTLAEIESKRTARGGFTKATLAEWGVPWPPPPNWRKDLIAGKDFGPMTQDVQTAMRAIKKFRPAKLAGFLGAWGCKCHLLTEEKLREAAMQIFKIEGDHSTQQVCEIVDLMGKDQRRMMVAEHVRKHHPHPDALWPKTALIRAVMGSERRRQAEPSFFRPSGRA